MNQSVCSALAAVFPLIAITVVLEGRNVAGRLRRGHKALEYLVSAAVGVGAVGLVTVVIGLQVPLSKEFAAVAWSMFIAEVLIMVLFTLLTAATYLDGPRLTPSRRVRPRTRTRAVSRFRARGFGVAD